MKAEPDFASLSRDDLKSPRQRVDESPKARVVNMVGGYSAPLRWYRRFRPRWLWKRSSLFGAPTVRYVEKFGLVVRNGPFEGLVYPKWLLGRSNHLASKLLGTYEPEVVALVARKIPEVDLFVDIGAGDGFFCVGAALCASDGRPPRVIGFELNRFEQKMIRDLARENGVSIDVRGGASISNLNVLPERKTLVLCDVEGLEAELLDPKAIPSLAEAFLVVEAHDQLVPGVSELIDRRFSETHVIERIAHTPRDPREFPELAGWDRESADVALFDGHGEGEGWLVLKPREV